MTSWTPPTVSELKALLADAGARPNRGRGQNFLVDPDAMRFVADAANFCPNDVVLEPGPGTGGLTGLMAEAAGAVVAVEVDKKLHTIADERLESFENVTVLHADIMGKGDTISPDALNAVAQAMKAAPDASFKMVANLPYRVSTAVITAILFGEPAPRDIVVTVQREVGDRICAEPGSGDYGYLSVIIQALAETKRLKILSPRAFWPQPEVESVVVGITPDPKRYEAVGDLDALKRVTSVLFRHRRKQAARALMMAKLVPDRAAAESLLRDVGADPHARPENLTVAQFIALAKKVSG